MSVRSAGILLHRGTGPELEVWIGHMGGPFWARKDEAAWSIPKGEYVEPELPLDAALREFEEEMGVAAPTAEYRFLGTFRYSSGKQLDVFDAEAREFDIAEVVGGTFDLEWPPRSGVIRAFPEIDRASWVRADDARRLLVAGQRPILDALVGYDDPATTSRAS